MNALVTDFDEAPATEHEGRAREHDAIRAAVKQEMADSDIKQSQVAKQIARDASTISLFLSGRYTGNNAAVARDLENWLDQRGKRADQDHTRIGQTVEWIETPTAKLIWTKLSACHTLGDFSLIYGAPGVSKTETAKHYRASYRNVWIVTIRPTTGSVKGMLKAIVRALGLEERISGKDADALSEGIIGHIEGTSGLLIIDEAQRLRQDSLDELRSIYDASGVAICLMGNEAVYSKTHGDRKDHAFAQLIRRIKLRTKIKSPTRADVTAIAAYFGITDKPALDILARIAAGPGALSHVVAAVQSAQLHPDFTGAVTASALQAAADEFEDPGE